MGLGIGWIITMLFVIIDNVGCVMHADANYTHIHKQTSSRTHTLTHSHAHAHKGRQTQTHARLATRKFFSVADDRNIKIFHSNLYVRQA